MNFDIAEEQQLLVGGVGRRAPVDDLRRATRLPEAPLQDLRDRLREWNGVAFEKRVAQCEQPVRARRRLVAPFRVAQPTAVDADLDLVLPARVGDPGSRDLAPTEERVVLQVASLLLPLLTPSPPLTREAQARLGDRPPQDEEAPSPC